VSSAVGEDPEWIYVEARLFGEVGVRRGGLVGARGVGEIADELAEIERKLDALAGAALGCGGLVFGVVESVALAEARSVEGEDHGRILAAISPRIGHRGSARAAQ
jgi:hypothetical protein